MADAVGLVVMTALYWTWVATVSGSRPSVTAWAGLFTLCALLALPGWRLPVPRLSRGWLIVAGYAALFAATFHGANMGLDALHGAQRRKADVALALGGIELWHVLCPGIVSVALGGCARSIWPAQR